MAKSTGFALHIGLNSVNPDHYAGWEGKLNACEADAEDMASIAKSMGYKRIDKQLTHKATRKSVVSALGTAAKTAKAGDIFFLSYSGHGGQLPDLNHEEDDGMDETWCLYDGELLDDELYAALSKFKKGVRIIVLSDSCHSGTVVKETYRRAASPSPDEAARSMPNEMALKTYRTNRAFYDKLLKTPKQKDSIKNSIKASVRLLSGCQDNQESLDGAFNGLFTAMLLRVWNEGKFKGNYFQFHKAILRNMPAKQSPNHFTMGASNPGFDKEKPFSV